jgi:hypothetical protein
MCAIYKAFSFHSIAIFAIYYDVFVISSWVFIGIFRKLSTSNYQIRNFQEKNC